jgi:hypothetical protein
LVMPLPDKWSDGSETSCGRAASRQVVYEGDLGVVLAVCGLCGHVDDLRGAGFDQPAGECEGVE